MRKRGKRILAGGLALCMTAGLSGCGKAEEELSKEIKNLMEGVTAQAATPKGELTDKELAAITDFSVRLLQDCVTEDAGENTIVSPLSVIYALAMTANGAEGETLTQMEAVLGMPVEELNECLQGCMEHYENAKYKLQLANSIWFTEEESRKFVANQSFLQKNADYYDAEIYQTVFDDAAKKAIN